MIGLQEPDLFKITGAKAKPVGRFMLFMLEFSEPIQQAFWGGSQMAWVRFMAESHHRFGHVHILLKGDPEQTMTVMTDEEFKK